MKNKLTPLRQAQGLTPTMKKQIEEYRNKFLSKKICNSSRQFNKEVSGKLPKLFEQHLITSMQKAREEGREEERKEIVKELKKMKYEGQNVYLNEAITDIINSLKGEV